CHERGSSQYLVDVEVNSYHHCVGMRFVLPSPNVDRGGRVEATLERAFRALSAAAKDNGGKLSYWGGNNYLVVSLPFRGPIREAFPEVDHLPWEERYRHLLEHAAWESLRQRVFRFSDLAESFADRCVECKLATVLIPSVGLCVHPWLFAER